KGDQVAFFRGGGDTLFPEELELLGDIDGKSLVHLQCNAGQDSLSLARRGARVLGVDLADHAIAFAQDLARQIFGDTVMAAQFVRDDVIDWMRNTPERFALAFSSYGAAGWLPDLASWAAGLFRVIEPGGAFVYVEFHPVLWSVARDLSLRGGDDYFAKAPFDDPVGDYVAKSGASLGGVEANAVALDNDIKAPSWQHGLGDVLSALAAAGFRLDVVREYPYANGCRVHDSLVDGGARRYVWPDGLARLPLMYGLRASRP
ncbi:MAG TPA: class I SAM-dependent methyltransferase, partial [Myxococcota bacterium]